MYDDAAPSIWARGMIQNTGRMRFRIKHVTRYVHEQPVSHSHNEVRLAPLDGPDQKRVAFNLQISPEAEITGYRDPFDNLVHSIAIDPPHRELVISSYSIVDRLEIAATPSTRITIREYLVGDEAQTREFGDLLNPSRYVPFSDRLRKFFWSVRPLLSEDVTAYVERMIAYVHAQFAYDRATTHVHSTVEDILTSGGGVCQDFAHLSIGLLRLAGIPARYVSGYLAPSPRRSARRASSRVGEPRMDRGSLARRGMDGIRSHASDAHHHSTYPRRDRQGLQ